MADITQNNPAKNQAVARNNARDGFWSFIGLIIALLVASPLIAIIILALNPTENIWPHLLSTVLPDYILETLLLMTGVGLLTFLIGTSTAWLISRCRFPGKVLLQWFLILPLAMPTYIIAYAYDDVMDYSGPLQTTLRELFNWTSRQDYYFPDIASLPGAIFVMSFVLYPYVYLMVRASLTRQSAAHSEASRTLGLSSWQTFFKITLPLLRPAIVVGITLALMECLNDIGAVEFFGVNTLTLGIYSTWLGTNNLGGAAQIAVVMLVFVFALIWLEKSSRSQQRYFNTTGREHKRRVMKLKGWKAWAATILCSFPFILGFATPALVLLEHAISNFDIAANADYFGHMFNSFTLAGIAAIATVSVGIFIAYGHRVSNSRLIHFTNIFASIGYAVPGTVLAIGILIPLAALDNSVDGFMRSTFGISTGLLLTGTMFALVFAYLVRFMALAYGSIENGLGRVSPNLGPAARTLGRSSGEALRDIHLPLIRPALAAAGLLVFVDCLKELPATLILRPFNFDTLATHVYTLASLDLFEESALSALSIVLVGVLPVILLNRTVKGSRKPLLKRLS